MLSEKKRQVLDNLKLFVSHVNSLPQHARLTPINHNDMCTILDLLIFVLDDEQLSEPENGH